MTDSIEPTQSPDDADSRWADDSEEVTVLTVPESSLPKAVVPARRTLADDRRVKAEGGLRIEPRVFAPMSREESSDAGEFEINRLGEDVVRLASGLAPVAEPKESPRPVMQKRVAREKSRDEELGESWGQAKKHSHRWMIFGGAGVLVAIVGGWSVQSYLSYRQESEVRTLGYSAVEVVDDVVSKEDVTAYFSENAGEVDRQMRETLTAYAHAQTIDQVEPLVRNGKTIRSLLTKHWKPWNAPKDWAPSAEALSGYSSVGKMPYGTMTGTGPDYRPFEVYFVRDGSRMLLDWEATTGYSDNPLSQLVGSSTQEAVVRAVAGSATYYSVAFPESDYAAYRLTSLQDEGLIWAYARKDTPAYDALEEMFGTTVILAEKKGNQAVRLRIGRGPQGAGANQWLIVDVLHKGWVSP